MSDLEHVTEAKVVRVEPGDVIFLRTDMRLGVGQAQAIKEQAREIWPDNQIVVAQELDIEIVRPA